jgi:TonB family protein
MLIVMLLVRQPLRKNIDANTVYKLWALLPLTLILYSIPLPWSYVSELNNVSLQTFLVQPTQNFHKNLNSNITFIQYLQWIYIIGTFLLVTYWSMSHVNYYKQLKLTRLSPINLLIVQKNKIPQKLVIQQSSHIYSPLIIGLFKQTLVIPEDFNELYNTEQQEMIIAHEVCHFSHYHMWTNQIALTLLALFWFHPLAWRAYTLFRQDQEHSCDQLVLSRKQTRSKVQYCKALVLAAETSPPNAFTLMSFKQNGEQNFMFNRIEQIKNETKKNNFLSATKLTLVVLVSASLLAGVSYAGNHLNQNKEFEQARIDVYPTYRIEPKYPIKAARERIEGSVVLKFDIEGDGTVANVEVVNGKPAYIFDKTAITALKQWRYKATGTSIKNQLVQLDYLMDNSKTNPVSLIERIKIKS